MIEPSLSGRLLFERLLAEGRLRVCRSPLFDEPAPHKGHIVAPDRVRGMLIGLAIGDALGNASEGMNPAERRRRHGEIRDYLPNWYADGRCVGLPSDDTQLAFWTLEHLLENEGRLVPELLAQMLAVLPATHHIRLRDLRLQFGNDVDLARFRHPDVLQHGLQSPGSARLAQADAVVLEAPRYCHS